MIMIRSCYGTRKWKCHMIMIRSCYGTPKKLAVKRLIDLHSVDVLFIQETMIEGGVLVQDLEFMIHGWKFISVDAMGRSGGLIVGWKSCNFFLS